MNNRIKDLFDSLTQEERILQFGQDGKDPLGAAFLKKRITHAGLAGRPVSATETQKIWQQLMQNPTSTAIKRSAYIHIPFCQTRCLYCGFFQNHCNEQAESEYVDLLIKELEDVERSPYIQQGLVHTVFLGGGTPSALSSKNIGRLLKSIKRYLPLANDYELTLEGRIHDLVPEKMDVWFANGVNRISIGVQSFQTKLRRQIGRLDEQNTVLKNLWAAAAYEQCSVVVDLIYGLPDQTMELWEWDLQILNELPIDGMDLYQLNVYEHSALKKAIDEGEISPAATTAQQAEMFAFAHDWLAKRPYRRLSNCHWAKNNRERSLYNTMNKNGAELIPFGSGAGGKIGDYSLMLHRALTPYKQFVATGMKPIMGLSLQAENHWLHKDVVGQLEQGYLNLGQLCNKYGEELQDLEWLMELWTSRGLMECNGVAYILTVAGQFWLVNITQTVLELTQFLLEGKYSLSVNPVAAQG